MIKKIMLVVALFVPMILSAQTLKVGLVDVNSVLPALPETTEAQNKINDVSKKYDAEYAKLGEEMKRLYDEFANLKEDELPAIRERKGRELADYQQKLENFERSAMQDLQRMQAELMQPILSKIQQAIESVGKEGGYSLMLTKDQQVVLYYAAPVEDATPAVKAKLGVK